MADDEEDVENAEEGEEAGAAEGEDGAEGEGEDGEGGGKKSKKKLIIIIAAVLVLIIGGGAGAYFTGALDGLLGKTPEQICEEVDDGHGNMVEECQDVVVEGEDGKEEEETAEATPGHFLKVPELIVNLSSTDNQPRFLKISVELEVETAEDVTQLEGVMPRIKDHFQTYLRELRVEDLRGSAGIYRLRLELLSRVSAAAPTIKVKDVLFQEILIQ